MSSANPTPVDFDAEFQLGEWRVDPSLNRISNGQATVQLEPLLMELLVFLARHAGQPVAKDEILHNVWQERFVSDSSLTRAVARLRRGLGDDAYNPRFIETISKRGYRLVAEVGPAPARPAPARPAPEPAPAVDLPRAEAAPAAPDAIRRPPAHLRRAGGVLVAIVAALLLAEAVYYGVRSWRSDPGVEPDTGSPTFIAVLPLEDLSPRPDGEYFADGMTEALITDLARVPSLRVISRRSVESYRTDRVSIAEIARRLGVELIVEGSIVRTGTRVRISVRLTQAATQAHLWGSSYEREWTDVLTLQGDVARAIAGEIRGAVAPAPVGMRAVNPAAHEAYLRGRYFLNQWTDESLRRAIEQFEASIDVDPLHAPSHAGLADAYSFLGSFAYLDPAEAYPRARAAAEKALELDESLSAAHTALGHIVFLSDRDWDAAERSFRRALELSPSYARAHDRYSYFLTCMGRFDEAVNEARRAIELDPLTATNHLHLGWVLVKAGRFDAAETQLLETRRIDPELTAVSNVLSWVYSLTGRYDEAIAAYNARWSWGQQGPPPGRDYWIRAWTQALAGRRGKALALVERIETELPAGTVPLYSMAAIHSALGDADAAMALLDQAWDEGSPDMIYLKIEPFFAGIRSDPRYQELLVKVGFPAD